MTSGTNFNAVYTTGTTALTETEINNLKTKFTNVLNQAQQNPQLYAAFAAGSEDVVMSSVADTKPDAIINASDGLDTFVIDNYLVNNIKDIDVAVTNFKDDKGANVKGYILTVTDSDGKKHTYKLANIEKIKFMDKNNTVYTAEFRDDLSNLTGSQASSPVSLYVTDSKRVAGVGKLSEFDDVVELEGRGNKINTLGGNDTIRVNNMNKNSRVESVNGGAGEDTIEFPNISEAEIKSVTHNKRNNIYTLTTTNGRSIDFKNVEKIKIGQNTYNITREEGKLTLEQRFTKGEVHFGLGDAQLLENGVIFGGRDDKIIVDTFSAFTSTADKASVFTGGEGGDVLDLSKISDLTVNSFSLADGVYTFKVTVGTETRTIKTKDIETLKFGTNTVTISTESLVAAGISNTSTTTPVTPTTPADNTITPEEAQWGTTPLTVIEGSNSTIDIVKLPEPVNMFYDASDNTIIVQRSNGKNIKLKSVEAVEIGGKKYRLLNNNNEKFGHTDLSTNTSYSVATFGPGNTKALTLSGDEFFFGVADANSTINAGAGNDTLYEMHYNNTNNVLVQNYDGGDGNNDTFVASFDKSNYSISKDGTVYTLTNTINGTQTKLANIENIVFTNADGSLASAVSLETFYLEKNPTATTTPINYLTWDGTSSGTFGTKNTLDILTLPSDVLLSQFSGVNLETSDISNFKLTYNGNEINLANCEYFKIGENYYSIDDLININSFFPNLTFANVKKTTINTTAVEGVRDGSTSSNAVLYTAFALNSTTTTQYIGRYNSEHAVELSSALGSPAGNNPENYSFKKDANGIITVYYDADGTGSGDPVQLNITLKNIDFYFIGGLKYRFSDYFNEPAVP